MKRCLDPVAGPDSRVLVLGSLPSDQSLQRGEYYGNPRNQFWTIIATALGAPLPGSYAEKLDMLRAGGIALWDMIAHAQRPGSLDSAIRDAVPNDIAGLLRAHPGIGRVLLNGGAAGRLYRKHCARLAVPHAVLPSTSPVPGRNIKPLEEKIRLWTQALNGR